MQKRYLEKGAEKKTYCALFLQEEKPDTEGAPIWKEQKVEAEIRQKLRDQMRHSLLDLLVVGDPGLQSAALLFREKEKELSPLFPGWLLEKVCFDESRSPSFRQWVSSRQDTIGRILSKQEETFRLSGELSPILLSASSFGIFGAMWELGEMLGCGIRAELLRIPMNQAVIEILEHFGLNPYQIPSEGAFLLVCKNGRMAEMALQEAGVSAACIGQLHPGAERILLSPDSVQHLNIPRQSDLADLKKVLKKKNSDNDFSL